MIGLRTGIAAGLRVGLAAGLGSDPLVPDSTGSNTTLTVALTDSADPVITSVAFSYSFVVTNTGGVAATSVSASVALDASLTYSSASGTGWAVDTSALPTVSFTRATGAVGAMPTITINVTSGGAALTASSAGNAVAANAPAATTSTQTTAVKLVSKDATSGIRVPATSTEWTDFIAYAGLSVSVPNSLWLCQEVSGNLADSIGSLALTALSTPSYRQAVTGWTRLATTAADASTSRYIVASGSGPNPATTSQTWLALMSITSAGGTRDVIGTGSTASTDVAMRVSTTGLIQNLCVNVQAQGADTTTFSNGVQPLVLKYDRTGAASLSYSLKEKVAGTYNSGAVDGNKGYFAAHGSTPAAAMVYACMWSSGAAEITDANIKALLTAMGYAIPWS